MVSQPKDNNGGSPATIGPGRGKLYAYEKPSMGPGLYDIKVKQTIAAKGDTSQTLDTVQRIQIQTVSPYSPLPSTLVHSFYPPRLRTVSANTLPHIVLKGALPWERPVQNLPPHQQEAKGRAPVPWLALLSFTADDLVLPADDVLTVGNDKAKTSATMAINLPVKAVNSQAAKFSLTKPFPLEDENATGVASDAGSSVNTANFIFVKAPVFAAYFSAQDEESEGANTGPNLQRYPYLAHVTDTGEVDDTGFGTIKTSTLLGHRIRPWNTPAASTDQGQQQSQGSVAVYAHLVSLEHVRLITEDIKQGDQAGQAVPLVSLFSWTYNWDIHDPTGGSTELFEDLSKHVRPLVVRLPDPAPDQNPSEAETWMRSRLDTGYTIVRHRDIAGEASMALFRGPLMPKPRSEQGSRRGRIPIIRPSMHGTDMQIIDVQTKMLDVSYSVAWDLGRSLAGRDAKFSRAVSLLRRELTNHAMMKAREAGQPSMIEGGDALIDSVLGRLDSLFEKDLSKVLNGMPEKGLVRWKQPSNRELASTTTTGVSSVIMTEAKLRRSLKSETRKWVSDMVEKLAQSTEINLGQSSGIEVPSLGTVVEWVLQNLLTLRHVPALHMFPDPSAIETETISMFAVDDIWVDALVDGALSVSNIMGGSDDPVRDEIRVAINKYILLAKPERVQIAAAGMVIKSQLAESFPDLSITAKCSNAGGSVVNPTFIRQASHGDIIVCLFTRTKDQRLEDFGVELKLPSHQQRFAIEGIKAESMNFEIELEPFLIAPPGATETVVQVTWNRGDKSCPWNWDTGLLSPHVIANLAETESNKRPSGTVKKLAADSRAIYLATQLADRDHSIMIPYKVKSDIQRQLFRHLDIPETEEDSQGQLGPRDPAQLHDPQSQPSQPGSATPPARPPSIPDSSDDTSRLVGKSWFTKRAFSLLYPGSSIPARSRPAATQLVFAIKPMPTAPTSLRVVSLEISIPIGDGSGDLLDHQAPIPRIKALNAGWPWIAAVFAKSDTELVVRLEPRVGGAESAVTEPGTGRLRVDPGADASFVLMGATVNGVVGSDVVIRTKEVYVEIADGERVREVSEEHEYRVNDSWLVSKEE
ncbi:hypothetical protein V8F33_006826 [Rhypophila sp. PSN 637]